MNRTPCTSHTHPLRIDDADIPGVPGAIGITLCPGKVQSGAVSGSWERDLVELGAMTPEEAIRQVRASRPGAIETPAQEKHVLATEVRR